MIFLPSDWVVQNKTFNQDWYSQKSNLYDENFYAVNWASLIEVSPTKALLALSYQRLPSFSSTFPTLIEPTQFCFERSRFQKLKTDAKTIYV